MKNSPDVQHDGGDARRANLDEASRILAVDDDAGNLIALQAILADLGQPVVCARSGKEALRHLLKEDFAVILLDAFMPGMDGYETASLIRARDKTKHVPIIFLSAINKESGHLVRGYEAGAVDYVFKPVEPMILRSKVSVFIELHKRALEIRRQGELERRLLTDNILVRTEQRRTEAALERSLAQQSLVIESLPLALYVASSQDGFRSRRLVGGRLDSLMGASGDERDPLDLMNWIDGVHPVDLPRVMDALEEASGSRIFSAEYRLKCADGKYRWFSDRAAHNTGVTEEQFGILLDISERRLLEEQLVHAQKMEFIGQMTGGIAHDFNNMLSVIIGSLDRALVTGVDDEKLRSRLDLAFQAANSCADLTKRLLSFSRRQELDPRPLSLCDELARLSEIFDRLLHDSITLKVVCSKQIWPVYLDASQFEAAVVNLVINSRDALPDGGRIALTATNREAAELDFTALGLRPDDYVELSVADNGAGMSEDVRSRAFEPFFTTKEAGKGTGLGLSSIYGFVRQSGGTIVIDSEIGKGTTVRMLLPRAATMEKPKTPARRNRHRKDVLKGLPVLLVEDEEKVRHLAASMLEEMGCEVTMAENGDHALDLVEAGAEPSVLFTDCMMPGRLDGPSLALELRRRIPGLPILFTSGVRNSVGSLEGEGNTVFLAKPYSAGQLSAALASLFSGRDEVVAMGR